MKLFTLRQKVPFLCSILSILTPCVVLANSNNQRDIAISLEDQVQQNQEAIRQLDQRLDSMMAILVKMQQTPNPTNPPSPIPNDMVPQDITSPDEATPQDDILSDYTPGFLLKVFDINDKISKGLPKGPQGAIELGAIPVQETGDLKYDAFSVEPSLKPLITPNLNSEIGCLWTGFVNIQENGIYTFSITTEAKNLRYAGTHNIENWRSVVTFNDKKIIDQKCTPAQVGSTRSRKPTQKANRMQIDLQKGLYPLEIWLAGSRSTENAKEFFHALHINFQIKEPSSRILTSPSEGRIQFLP